MTEVCRRENFIAVLVSVFFLGGCAFGTREATLIYPPAPEPGGMPVAQAAARQDSKNISVALAAFNDQRSDKKVVGTVRNGFGMRTADVVPGNSVPAWVAQALKTELQNNGYTVISAAPGDSSAMAGAVISGEILNVFCDMYFTYTGQVSLVVKVTKGGKEVYNKHYAGEGSAGVAWAGTADSFAQSLALALSAAARQLIADLDQNLLLK
jgi:uncharacterized lipoprotein YajG